MRKKGIFGRLGKMKSTVLLILVFLSLALAYHDAAAQAPAAKGAKPGPDLRLVLGVLRPGSNTYSAGLAVTQVVNSYTNLKMIVQPYPTIVGTFPYMKTGAVQVLFCPAEQLEAYAFGIKTLANPEDKPAYPELRLLMGSYYLYSAWVTRPDPGIKTIADLKGHKLFWKSQAGFSSQIYAEDTLRSYGLDPDKDVTSIVGYEALPAAYKAIQTKKIDALFGATGGAQMEELNATTGCQVLPFPAERIKDLRISTKEIVTVPANFMPGIKVPTPVIARKEVVFANKNVPDEAAYYMVKSIVEHHAELGNVQELREWGKEYAMPTLSNIVVPFHPGVIKYFKEIGLWTPQIEAHNKDLLSKIQKVKP